MRVKDEGDVADGAGYKGLAAPTLLIWPSSELLCNINIVITHRSSMSTKKNEHAHGYEFGGP